MDIVSLLWLFWMAITVVGYWAVPARFREPWLAGLTLAFLAYYSAESAVTLCLFTVALYYLTDRDHLSGYRSLGIAAGVVTILVYYKLRIAIGFTDFVGQVAIPLGLSYYAFRCLHYLIERYKGTIPRHSFEHFFSYLFFLPTLLAGPIHRFPEFRRDLQRKRWDSRNFSEGLERILYGYLTIVFLANFLVNQSFAKFIESLDPERESLVAYLTMLKLGFNGYLQFSGYSSIAIGFALLLGYRVMENFNWPLIRRNISEFWQCWHISLSSWCRQYVYMTVISATRQPAIAALSSMLVLGLWHEISYRYVLWGLYHGAGIAVWQQWQQVKPLVPMPSGTAARVLGTGASILLTFHFVMLGFLIPLGDSVSETLGMFRSILLFWL